MNEKIEVVAWMIPATSLPGQILHLEDNEEDANFWRGHGREVIPLADATKLQALQDRVVELEKELAVTKLQIDEGWNAHKVVRREYAEVKYGPTRLNNPVSIASPVDAAIQRASDMVTAGLKKEQP